jgi:hypothetical protein
LLADREFDGVALRFCKFGAGELPLGPEAFGLGEPAWFR